MKSSLLLYLKAFPFGIAIPNPSNPQPNLPTITDLLIFSISIQEFSYRRTTYDPPQLDWSSDGCTSAPNDPLGFNFLPSCQRHDFGYRNSKKQNRFTLAQKAKIDANFKKDMDSQCTHEALEDVCMDLAEMYYGAVTKFGFKKEPSVEVRL